MKKTLLFILLTTFCFTTLGAQETCSTYYPMKEGASFAYNLYNKKGKLDGKTNHSIIKVDNSSGQTKATLKIEYQNAKGKSELESNYDITCTGTGIKVDFMSLMPSQMLDQYKEMNVEMDIEGTDIELPNNLSVGQELNDANVNMKMDMAGINMNINVSTINRKVEKKETLTTPAGTFDCYVLSETISSKTMGTNINILSKTWLVQGIGMIKNETYKKNGDLQSKTELVAYSN